MKKATTFLINDIEIIKLKMLSWANQFGIFCFMNNNGYCFDAPSFECLLAAGSEKNFHSNNASALDDLSQFATQQNDWLFGHLGYDLKNNLEKLTSQHYDGIGFDNSFFFVPQTVIKIKKDELFIYTNQDANEIFSSICNQPLLETSSVTVPVVLKSRIQQPDYIDTIQKLKAHILKGDCYEINYCQEFYANNIWIDPLKVYQKLNAISPAPFSVLYKMDNKFCIGASPERYLKKENSTIISQPIKGTSKRDLQNPIQDEKNKQQLYESEKEKSENVMVVDLVRNDLSKVCKNGSVKVEELFGIYSFPQVHQMISTISGELEEGVDWVDIIKASFPMGSMTGAPKKKVMELIEEYEQTKRGLFSGAIGYVSPHGDFDFNVVIRSILYNSDNRYLSIQAGSAITFHCDEAAEYQECLLKITALKKALE